MRGVLQVLGSMSLMALVMGTAAAVLGTGRVTVPLLASTTLVWSFVPVVQLLTGLVFVRRSNRPTAEALAAYFSTGTPWSVWILTVTGAALLWPDLWSRLLWLLPTTLIPIVLTSRALWRLRWLELGDSSGSALRRVVLHQSLTQAIIVAYIAWAVALWPRIVAVVWP
jgi:hypothetical protein